MLVRKAEAERVACLLCLLFCCIAVPLRRKLKVQQVVQYIGLLVKVATFTLSLCEVKLSKLKGFLAGLFKEDRIDKKSFASAVLPSMRPWLSTFYKNINMPGLAWVSGAPGATHAVLCALAVDGRAGEDVPSSGVRRGMLLCFVGKSSITAPWKWKGWWPKKNISLGFIASCDRRVKVSRESQLVARAWNVALTSGRHLLPCSTRASWAVRRQQTLVCR